MFEEILNNHLRKCSDLTSYLTKYDDAKSTQESETNVKKYYRVQRGAERDDAGNEKIKI